MRYCTLGTSAHRIERAMTPVALKIFMALTVVMLTGTTFSSKSSALYEATHC